MIGQLVYDGIIGMVVEEVDLHYRVDWYWPDCIKSDWYSPGSLKIYVINYERLRNGTIKSLPSYERG